MIISTKIKDLIELFVGIGRSSPLDVAEVSKKASISRDFDGIISILGDTYVIRRKGENMENRSYRADPQMIPPVVLAMGFGAFLLVLEGATNKGFLLLVLLLPFYYLGAEILARRISIDSEGLEIAKLLRTVRIEWPDIKYLDAVRSGSKLFLILQPENGRPVLITNTIRPFQDLAHRILENVSHDKVSDYAREVIQDPPTKRGPMIQAWIVCVVLVGLVAGKLLGYSANW